MAAQSAANTGKSALRQSQSALLPSLLGNINVKDEETNVGPTSALPKMPLSSRLNFCSAQIDVLERSISECVRASQARDRMKTHLHQARYSANGVATIQSCLDVIEKKASETHELDENTINTLKGAKRRHAEAAASHHLACRLYEAVRAFETFESQTCVPLDAKASSFALHNAREALGLFNSAVRHSVHSTTPYSKEIGDEYYRQDLSPICEACPSLALKELQLRSERAVKLFDDQLDDCWSRLVSVSFSEEGKRVIKIALGSSIEAFGDTRKDSLATLCEVLDAREELEPRLLKLSAQLLEGFVIPILRPHQVLEAAWRHQHIREMERTSVSIVKAFAKPHEAALMSLQTLEAIFAFLAINLFKYEQALNYQHFFSRDLIPLVTDRCILYLESRMPSTLSFPFQECIQPVLQQLAGAARGLHGTLQQHRYISDEASGEDDTSDGRNKRLHAEDLLKWADTVLYRMFVRLAEEAKAEARSLMARKDDVDGGWEGCRVELEAEVDIFKAAVQDPKALQGDAAQDNSNHISKDASILGKGGHISKHPVEAIEEMTVKAPAPFQSNSLPIQSPLGTKARGKLGGVRRLKPEGQLGSGPLPDESEITDDSLWGFEDTSDPAALPPFTSLASSSSSPAPLPRTDSICSRPNFTPFESRFQEQQEMEGEEAWFTEVEPQEGEALLSVATAAEALAGKLSAEARDTTQEDKTSLVENEEDSLDVTVDEDAWGLSAQEKLELAERRGSKLKSSQEPLAPLASFAGPSSDARYTRSSALHIADPLEETSMRIGSSTDSVPPQRMMMARENLPDRVRASSGDESGKDMSSRNYFGHTDNRTVYQPSDRTDNVPHDLSRSSADVLLQSDTLPSGKTALDVREGSQVNLNDNTAYVGQTSPREGSARSQEKPHNVECVRPRLSMVTYDGGDIDSSAAGLDCLKRGRESPERTKATLCEENVARSVQGADEDRKCDNPVKNDSTWRSSSENEVTTSSSIRIPLVSEGSQWQNTVPRAPAASTANESGNDLPTEMTLAEVGGSGAALDSEDLSDAGGSRTRVLTSPTILDTTNEYTVDPTKYPHYRSSHPNRNQQLRGANLPAAPLFRQVDGRKEYCTISRRSLDLVHLCDRLLRDVLQLGSEVRDTDARPLMTSIIDIIDLHRAMMPVTHEELLANVPSLSMQFANDCLFIAIELAKMRSRLDSSSWRHSLVIDEIKRQELLTTLMGRRSFDAQMILQEGILRDLLSDAEGFSRLHDKERFAACQRCVKQLHFTLNQLSKAWKSVLARTTYLAAMGKLVDGVFTQILRHIIEDLNDITEEESERLAALVRSLGNVESLFEDSEGAGGRQTMVAIFVPMWFKASYLGEILTGSLVDIEFLYFDASALVDYSKKEIVKLIKSLFSDTAKRRQLIDRINNA